MLLAYAWVFLAFSLVMFIIWDKFKKRLTHSDERILLEDALKVYPGAHTRKLENSAARAFNESITVSAAGGNGKPAEAYQNLSSIKEGETVVVAELSQALRGPVRRRLLDLGIVPGTKIKAVISSIGGDPRAYEVRGALIALRKDQTDHIYIKRM